MKIYLWLAVLLLAASPVFALFCQYCGKPMADDANFCPVCGKARAASGVSTPAPAPVTTSPAPVVVQQPAPAPTPVPVPILEVPRSFLDGYQAIDQWETILTGADSPIPSTRINEYRTRIDRDLYRQEAGLPRFSPVERKFHSLYMKKNDILDKLREAVYQSFHSSRKGEAGARREKYRFMLEEIDGMIQTLLEGQNDPQILSKIGAMENELADATREFLITVPYIKIGSFRASRNRPIWVMDIENGLARVMYMGETSSPVPISGWISLYDLQFRTTWGGTYKNVSYQPPVTTEVIIIDDGHHHPPPPPPPHWPWPWGKHKDRNGRHGGHDKDRGHDSGHGRGAPPSHPQPAPPGPPPGKNPGGPGHPRHSLAAPAASSTQSVSPQQPGSVSVSPSTQNRNSQK